MEGEGKKRGGGEGRGARAEQTVIFLLSLKEVRRSRFQDTSIHLNSFFLSSFRFYPISLFFSFTSFPRSSSFNVVLFILFISISRPFFLQIYPYTDELIHKPQIYTEDRTGEPVRGPANHRSGVTRPSAQSDLRRDMKAQYQVVVYVYTYVCTYTLIKLCVIST